MDHNVGEVLYLNVILVNKYFFTAFHLHCGPFKCWLYYYFMSVNSPLAKWV